MNKICNVDGFCEHRAQGQLGWICKYVFYCDFQAPRDSRQITLLPEEPKSFNKPLTNDGN